MKNQNNSIKIGKESNRTHLCKKLHLDHKARPLVCAITRLVEQKGPRFIEQAIDYTLSSNGAFILLAGHPEPKEKERFTKLERRINSPSKLFIHYEFDEDLAHQIYAGSDVIIIPSSFEPCGLTQMIAMRYGTIPIVHHTGGLADTVLHEINGFSYKFQEKSVFEACLKTAFECFANDKSKWLDMMKYGMNQDFSWKNSAKKYLEIYSIHKPIQNLEF
ncbi:MAG: glycosyltransferase [Simkaniaceae bacterium]|nr:glycosyltransferase [Simkaniaceae bacterium]